MGRWGGLPPPTHPPLRFTQTWVEYIRRCRLKRKKVQRLTLKVKLSALEHFLLESAHSFSTGPDSTNGEWKNQK